MSGVPVVESVISGLVALSALYCLFSCCCLIKYLCRKRRRQRRRENEAVTTISGRLHQTNTGNDLLRQKIIDTFLSGLGNREDTGNKFSYSKKTEAFSKRVGSCPICCEDYNGNPDEILLGLLKKCGHYFHFDCIWPWLEEKKNCPLCRQVACLAEEDVRGISLASILGDHSPSGTICSKTSSKGTDNPAFVNDADKQSVRSLRVHSYAQRVDPPNTVQAPDAEPEDVESLQLEEPRDPHLQCLVCKSGFVGDPAGVIVGYLPQCGHFFHYDCISRYIKDDNSCPSCPACNVSRQHSTPLFFAVLKDICPEQGGVVDETCSRNQETSNAT